MSMNDDVPAAAGEDLSSGGTADTSRRSGRAKRSGTFVYPLPSTPLPSSTPLTSTPDPGTHRMSVGDASSLEGDPAGGVGAGNSEEGTTLVSSTGTNGSASGPATTTTTPTATESLGTITAPGPVPSRRNSMGVASVRIAARLAQNELTSRDSRSTGSHGDPRSTGSHGDPRSTGSHGDPIADNDELLTLLGEYLLAGGLEKPEIHATLGGQPIVVDLQVPQRHAR
ncbi:hypothetical protein CEJ39_08040 [Rhodococcus pyridinivorans]|uniref:Uncharacterized protein n=1 Tax=Rhodococcus pyridinivorans AK37 TaxID=1114960 RepID=H0JW38_9NOCA|nr:hypothetical protein [Rhodococcus pyridinivorans]AWZ24141.1 hypothetical protein CEJ39_08040 [Rhodococcus pyridinivorans]EHK81589.1 hypothetical protein AK37_19553 [Rhodococcus pyridinivorans AK37]MCD2142671.1 hypothetical protein [Rhodococcus pyridinivorans]